MKSRKKVASLFLLAFLLCLPFSLPVKAVEQPAASDDLRGVWISSVLNLDYPASPTTNAEQLKKEATEALDFAKKNGFNAIFLQVRPTCDALYSSKIFPWSKYLTGTQGKSPDGGFDPLAFYVLEAHKRGLSLHAWINPFRITRDSSAISSLAASNPARKNPSWVVKGADGFLYFDPGIPGVRQLVIDGVIEIIKNYDIDGIHLDDYFYPSKDFSDAATYKAYGKKSKSLDDFRRNNINLLIKNMGIAIKKADADVRFGVSPFGIWANSSTLSDGSRTSGAQSYFDDYADSRRWVKEGWIDYIAPQIYWNIGHDKADYETLVSWWNDVVLGTNVRLYIGHAAYRWKDAEKTSPWYGTGELTRQLSLNRFYGNVSGSIFFRLGTIRENAAVADELKTFFQNADTPLFFIGRPSADIRTTLERFYVTGASDPNKPLTLNGKTVENRSRSGFFGVLVPLQNGVNTLTFSQGDKTLTRVIYRGAQAPVYKTMDSAAIVKSSVYPQTQELMQKAKTITLSCTAPKGAKVTVTLNGRTLTMKQAKTSSPNDGKLYEARFEASYTVSQQKTGMLYLGTPVYKMTYNKKSDTVTAPQSVTVAFGKVPLLAEVTASCADTYPYANAALGADGPLYKGMRDYVEIITGNYVKLSSGKWIKKANVKLLEAGSGYFPQIISATYKKGTSEDVISFATSLSPAALLSFSEDTLALSFPNLNKIVRPKLPKGALCSSIDMDLKDSKGSYVFRFSNMKTLGGYYIRPTDAGFDLVLRRKPAAKTGSLPLSGITILLDAGHGGDDPGAIGPMGALCPEKTVNLSLTLKLKKELAALGANVLLTRGSDLGVSLYDRLDLSYEKQPHLFLSLHANSMSDDTDISKCSGASVFYREKWLDGFAKSILKSASTDIGRKDAGTHIRQHYLTKATFTPSLILETGFLPNPQDFEWIRDSSEQEKLAKSLASCILEYFKT